MNKEDKAVNAVRKVLDEFGNNKDWQKCILIITHNVIEDEQKRFALSLQAITEEMKAYEERRRNR